MYVCGSLRLSICLLGMKLVVSFVCFCRWFDSGSSYLRVVDLPSLDDSLHHFSFTPQRFMELLPSSFLVSDCDSMPMRRALGLVDDYE